MFGCKCAWRATIQFTGFRKRSKQMACSPAAASPQSNPASCPSSNGRAADQMPCRPVMDSSTRAASILAQLTYRAARLWREHPWQAPLPSFTWPQRNIFLPALLLASPSAFSRCVRCLRNRRFFNPRRLRKRYVGRGHVLDVGYCFINGSRGPRRNVFTRKNRRFSGTFSVPFRDIVRDGGQVDAGPD